MNILGIESSCDECAAALVVDGRTVLASRVASQIPIHSAYGGVVPELASRDHIRKIIPVISDVLKNADLSLEELDGIGVTAGPGLIGSLLVGVSVAKTLAWCLRKPLVGIHHLEAHLHAIFLERLFDYPHLGLVVSGGHTSLFRVSGVAELNVIGRTLDDAAGEAFDKISKLLGLGYPGGVYIERAAQGGEPTAIHFPRPLPGKRLDFSFSGLKTAVAVHIKEYGLPLEDKLQDFAASVQEAIVDTLVNKTIMAAQVNKLERILVAGGVAANIRLRQKMREKAYENGFEVVFPAVSLCTDNAAMVGALAYHYLCLGRDDTLSLDADAGMEWD